MYADPSLIRDKTVKLSFNDLENDLIQAWVNYHGGEKLHLSASWCSSRRGLILVSMSLQVNCLKWNF